MSFNTDKQTLDDLNIIGKPGGDSIYHIFNNTHTRGGADILEQMFLYPMGEAEAINTRSQIIQYFKYCCSVILFVFARRTETRLIYAI